MRPQFTPDQERAIETLEGDVAIRAGAGSGKTTVLAYRFAHALAAGIPSGPVPVDGVLTITFTNKAAGEIAERVRRVVGQTVSVEAGREVDRAWISTIHSLCARLLRRHVIESEVTPTFRLADDATARTLSSAAYEQAVFSLVGNDESAALLVDSFGASALRDMVVTCHDQVRAMGLDPHETTVEVDPAGLGALKAAVVRAACEFEDAIAEGNEKPGRLAARVYLAEWKASLHECDAETQDGARIACQICEDFKLTAPNGTSGHKKRLEARRKELLRCLRALEHAEVIASLRPLIAGYSAAYRELKLRNGVLDFDDLQERAVAMLESNPQIAERYRRQFGLVMVDEFQDTNELQMRVLSALNDGNLCVVGDERQSIYGWRFADVSIFRRLAASADTPIPLRANFRSHPQVLGFVNALFSQPHLFGPDFMQLHAGREEQPPFPVPDGEPRVECLLVDFRRPAKVSDAVQIEAAAIASRAAQLVTSGVDPGDVAVIVRSGTHASQYARALEEAGLSVALSAGSALFEAPEVATVTEMLRALVVPADDEALLALLAGPMVSVSDDALVAVREAAGASYLWEGVKLCAEGGGNDLGPEDRAALRRCRDVVDHFGVRYGSMRLSDVVRDACEAFDYDVTLSTRGSEGARAWGNVLKIARYADAFEASDGNDPARFVEYLSVCREYSKDNPAPADSGGQSVRVLTIHAAKGLEFPVVFVAGLRTRKYQEPDDILVEAVGAGETSVPRAAVRMPIKVFDQATTPAYYRLWQADVDAQQEEEKRALYVACTRAREMLFLSAATDLAKDASTGSLLIDWVREGLPSEDAEVTRVGEAAVRVHVLEAAPSEDGEPTSADRAGDPHGPLVAGEFEPGGPAPAAPVPPTVSYSSLHLYGLCPLAFHARYVLRMQRFRDPETPTATGLGSAAHAWFQSWASGHDVSEAREAAISRQFALDETQAGRISAAATRFTSSDVARRIRGADSCIPETPIRVALGTTMLTGAIDLVALEGDRALVVDYKTGEAPGMHGERLPGYELQAQCYALAALEAGAQKAEVHFVFVEHEVDDLVFEYGRESQDELREKLTAIVERMRTQPLSHLGAFDARTCGDCPALETLCPIDRPAWTRHS